MFTRGCCGGGVGEAGFVIIVGLAFKKLMTGSPEETRLSSWA